MKEVHIIENHEVANANLPTTVGLLRVKSLQVLHEPSHNQTVALQFQTTSILEDYDQSLCLLLSVPAAYELRRQLGVTIREYLHSETE